MSATDTIKEILKTKNISHIELAERLNTTKQNVSNKFKRDSFSALDLVEIADVLNLELVYLDKEDKCTYKIDYNPEQKFKSKRNESEEDKKTLIEKAMKTKSTK